MANGCLRVTPALFKGMTQDEKLDCLFEVAMDTQIRVAKIEKWGWLKVSTQFFASMIGGALILLFAMHYGVKL
jgi:hypothetical protein